MGAEYLFYVKSIATFATTFYGYIISVLASVRQLRIHGMIDSFLLFYIIFQEMKSNETRDTRGVFFVVADDLKNSETLKSEASRRVIFTILRHFQLIREIRGPLSLVRYAAVV